MIYNLIMDLNMFAERFDRRRIFIHRLRCMILDWIWWRFNGLMKMHSRLILRLEMIFRPIIKKRGIAFQLISSAQDSCVIIYHIWYGWFVMLYEWRSFCHVESCNEFEHRMRSCWQITERWIVDCGEWLIDLDVLRTFAMMGALSWQVKRSQ